MKIHQLFPWGIDGCPVLSYRSTKDPRLALRARLREIARTRVRYGYRRILVLLRREGWQLGEDLVYRLYVGEGLESIHSATIIVTEANKALELIHDRMPVILPAVAYDEWLDQAVTDKKRLQKILVPYPDNEIDMYPVSRYVNNTRNDDELCIAPGN